jgi:hypothetical protein
MDFCAYVCVCFSLFATPTRSKHASNAHTRTQGRSPLYVAVEAKETAETMLRLLLRFGGDPNAADVAGTPMAVFPVRLPAFCVSVFCIR